jgi:hypothetical protein
MPFGVSRSQFKLIKSYSWMNMATVEDVVLLVMTLMSVSMFIIAVLYRCRSIICHMDEIGIHMATVLMSFTLVMASIRLDKPVFVVAGLSIFAAIAVYYLLLNKKEEAEEYR